MTRVDVGVEIAATRSRVFSYVGAEWETDLDLLGGRAMRWRPLTSAGLRPGFRADFDGSLLALPGSWEIEVLDLVDQHRWTAASTADRSLIWAWEFSPCRGGCRVRQTCEWQASGLPARLWDRSVGRRRRRQIVGHSLDRLKRRVEREVAIGRLRPTPPPMPRGAGDCPPR